MRDFLAYCRFQYYFWLLHKSQRTEDGNWVVTQRTIALFRKCFSCIPASAYEVFTRASLQTISFDCHVEGYLTWSRKAEVALPLIIHAQDFSSDWVVGRQRSVTLETYSTEGGIWYSQLEIVTGTLNRLESLIKALDETEISNRDYCLLKINKLLKDGAGYLLLLLLEYKETQWHQVTKKKVL